MSDAGRARELLAREEFWRGVLGAEVYDPLPGAVKNELHDYLIVMREVSKAYDEITVGRFSKPNTMAEYIIDRVNERLGEAYQDGWNEAKADGE